MNFKPLFDRVVIEPIKNKTVSAGGIVLPETSQERPQMGYIVAVGDGENFDGTTNKMKVKVGDKVLFERYAGVELKLDGNVYIVMRQIDIVGVVNGWKNYCSRRRC